LNVALPIRPPSAASSSRLREALRRAARRLNLRVLGVTLAIALGFQVWLLVEIREIYPTMSVGQTYLSGTIINLFMSLGIMFATLVADEAVDLGARRLPAYAWAVACGAAAGAFAQWLAHRWLRVVPVNLDVPSSNPLYDVSGRLHVPAVDVTQPIVMFFEFLIWGSIIVSIYVERRSALRAAQRMSAAHVARANAQRRTLESHLQALQARVEPQFLFDTLAKVRDLYARDPAMGGRMLDDLIVYLRAALPHLRESASTLGREVELASAYLRIVHEPDGGPPRFEIRVPVAMQTARVPAMILLPLAQSLYGGGTVRLTAAKSDGGLRLELGSEGYRGASESAQDVVRTVRARLEGLYGERGRLDLEMPATGGTRLVMEIPDERADGDHR
jgi:hypothetical protein